MMKCSKEIIFAFIDKFREAEGTLSEQRKWALKKHTELRKTHKENCKRRKIICKEEGEYELKFSGIYDKIKIKEKRQQDIRSYAFIYEKHKYVTKKRKSHTTPIVSPQLKKYAL